MATPPGSSDCDVAVVGAGAAGFMAAIAAAEAGARTLLFNAHPKPGLKILMSGGTRCNVTHATVGPESFHAASRPSVGLVLKTFPAAAVRAWFEARGVPLKEEPGGKLFPMSDSARTVVERLLAATTDAGVGLRFGERVTAIEAAADGFRLASIAAGGVARATTGRAVVLATGGLSFPRTGSDGGGYGLATALGHTLTPRTPALTPLVLAGDRLAPLAGLTLPAALTLHLDGRRAVTCAGSLLVTHVGLSGPAALDLSRHWLRAPAGAARHVTAHWLPGPARPIEDGGGLLDPAAAERAGGLPDVARLEAGWLADAAGEAPTVGQWLGRRVPARLARLLLDEAGLAAGVRLTQASREARRRLLDALVAFRLDVVDTLGYAKAEVTAGGVPLEEIDVRRMMSRRCPGLFLAGEICDVDGRLGGYNFQWAWSSGRLAGRSAADYLADAGPGRPGAGNAGPDNPLRGGS